MSVLAERTEIDPHRWRSLAVLLTASALVFADTGIMIVAIPAMQRTLHAGAGQITLAVSVYQIVLGVAAIPAGRAGDIWGTRRVLLFGVAGFATTSALCALAPDGATLVLARAAQGLCGALIMPQAATFVRLAFPADERPHAFAMTGAVVGTAAIAGPVIGGLAVGLNPLGLSWRAAFAVNVPIGAAALVGIASRFPRDAARQRVPGQLDLPGAALLGIGLSAVLAALLTGRDQGWSGWQTALVALSVPVLIAFAVLERRRAAASRPAIVSAGLLGDRAFRVSVAIYVLLFGGAGAFGLVLMLYAQHGLGMSALQAAAIGAASPVGSLTAMVTSARAERMLRHRAFAVGFWLVVVCTAILIAQVLTFRQPHDGYWLTPMIALSGFGFGLVTPRLLGFALGTIAVTEVGTAAGVLSSVQTLSRGVGVAGVGALFLALAARAPSLSGAFRSIPAAVGGCVTEQLARGDGITARATCPALAPQASRQAVTTAVDAILQHGFGAACAWSLAVMTVLFLLSLGLAARHGALTDPADGARR